jgi:HEAT repeats
MRMAYAFVAVVGLLPTPVLGQNLEQRIAGVGDGTVRLSFAARPGVCRDGAHQLGDNHGSDEWEPDCERQLVRVALRVRGGLPVAVRTYIGGRWRAGSSARDLGTVGAEAAAEYFLRLAGQTRGVSGDPVLPATLADSAVIWRSLLALARAEHLPQERRQSAVFWLGQAAGESVAGALDSIALDESGSRDIRKHAVFALSQRSTEEAVPALIRIARTNRDPELRRTALFWLGQSEDPRALDLFEELLR